MVRVIFLENIEDNKAGDVKVVADGYARNFLFRRGVAKVATEEELKNLETKIEKIKKEEEEKVKGAEKLSQKLSKEVLTLEEEVNDEGHLYGSVTNREIAEKLHEAGYEIDSGEIEVLDPIKEIGEYTVNVKVGHGVETKLKVKIDRKKE